MLAIQEFVANGAGRPSRGRRSAASPGADGHPWPWGSAWLLAFRSAIDTRRGPACCSVGAKRERSGGPVGPSLAAPRRPTEKRSERPTWRLLGRQNDSAGRSLDGTSHAISKHVRSRSIRLRRRTPVHAKAEIRANPQRRPDGRRKPRGPEMATGGALRSGGHKPALT